MAAPFKQGLGYFPLDVDFLQDIKIRKIKTAYGAKSISVLINLLCNIYHDKGYYIEWDADQAFIIAEYFGMTEGAVQDIVEKAVQVGLFDSGIFEKKQILTSKRIQKTFCGVAKQAKKKKICGLRDIALIPEITELIQEETELIPEKTELIPELIDKRKESKEKGKGKEREREIPPASPISEAVIKSASQLLGGMVSPSQYQILESLSETYSEDWILSAIQIANERDRRALPYVRGILQRFAAQGGKDAPAPSKGRKSETAADCIERYMAAMQGR